MMRLTVTALAGLALASCLVAGAGSAGPYSGAEIKKYRNFTQYDVSFYERLLGGRVFVFESPGKDRTYDNVPLALIFSEDGRRLRCTALRADGHLSWIGTEPGRWSVAWGGHGANVRYENRKGKPRYAWFFYEPETGSTEIEVFLDEDGEDRIWIRPNSGWIQGTLPRSLADACPNLGLPAGLRINEKQTSQNFDELRRQDPGAPVRNFPGSHLTAPGRTGLAASGLRPTTTRKEVWAFMRAQHGNIVLSPKGNPRVLVVGGNTWAHELWQLAKNGKIENTSEFHEVKDEDGEWLEGRRKGKLLGRYPMGYPFPYLPTGHRHGAFRLTDGLVGGAEAVALPFMGEAYADRRFVFIGDGNLSVVDLDGNLAPGEGFEGTWRWTRGRLEVRVAGDSRVHGIDWRDLAREFGEKPVLVTRAMLNGR